jgi:transmembrane sensor
VQVAAGAIVLAAAAQNGLQLKPGQGIEIAEKSDQARLYKIQPNHVAGWQIGQLTYDDVPISVVVGDLQRASGLTLALDPRIADQRFTGVLTIGDGARLVSDFSHLTGFVAEKRGQAIIFLPQH